jgi:hypothetical protein
VSAQKHLDEARTYAAEVEATAYRGNTAAAESAAVGLMSAWKALDEALTGGEELPRDWQQT